MARAILTSRRLRAALRRFIKMTLGAPTGTDVEALKAENESLKEAKDKLEADLAAATKKLEELAPPA